MKKNRFTIYSKKIISIVAVLLFTTSCADTFLNLDPEDSIPDANAIVDVKTAEAALNGAYSRLQSADYYGGGGFVSAIYLAGDNITWVGSLNYYRDFNTHEILADNTTIESAWKAIFKAVNASNQVIDKTNALAGIPENDRSRIVGQALFIRALAYFDLGRTWGNVPIVTKATATARDFKGIKQSNQKAVYQQVITDLTRALPLLPTTLNRTHATVASANALLARTYLYLGDYIKAEEYASLLIADTNYKLLDYPNFFQEKETAESILELNFTTSDNNSHWTYWFAPAKGGRHEWQPSIELIQLLNDPNIGGTRKALFRDSSTPSNPNYYEGLLYHRPNGDDPAYLFRISEQYLIRAEARAKKANPILSDVLSDLFAVQDRAKAKRSTATTINQATLDIENERRVEFPLEPHRWYDLVRTGRAGDVLGVKDARKWIFPIPYNDIQADKGDLEQNDGY